MSYDDPTPEEAARYMLQGNLGINGITEGLRPSAAYYRRLLKELRESRGEFREANKEWVLDEDMATLRDALHEQEILESGRTESARFKIATGLQVLAIGISVVLLGIVVYVNFIQ